MAKSMIGFDIGTQELKIVQWDGSRVRRAVSVPTPTGLVRDGQTSSPEELVNFIKTSARENKISGRSCAVILPASQTFLRRVTLPAMDVEQLMVNLPYEFRDLLTMEKDKYYYDYAVNEILRDEDGKPTELDLTACAVAKNVIDEYRELFRQAGFKLKTAIPVECAYANLIAHKGVGPKDELCIIDMGHAATRVYIYVGGHYETSRIIEEGLGYLEGRISDGMGVDIHLAHTYLQTNHDGMQEREGSQEVYQSICLDIRKTVNFYGFNHRDTTLNEAWCIGGGIQYPTFLNTISQTLDLEVHASDTWLPNAEPTEQPLSIFAAAIGAAIQ